MRRRRKRSDPALGAFLVHRLMACSLAELFYLLGNLAPPRLAEVLWSLCLRLNAHHRAAAVNRALALLDRDREAAWAAFDAVLEQLANRGDTSASDLYLTWIPGRTARRAVARLLSGAAAGSPQDAHDRALLDACRRLARAHFRRHLESGDLERAAAALGARESLGGAPAELGWGAAELAWRRGDTRTVVAELEPLLAAGTFLSPLDPPRWARRLLAAGERELAARCLAWARRLVPELPAVWFLAAELARQEGDRRSAGELLERALALEPQNLDGFLAWLGVERGREIPPPDDPLEVEAPAEIPVGERRSTTCRIDGGDRRWELFVLPPAGRGVLPAARRVPFDAAGRAAVDLEAHRPHRVHGGPWPLLFVAVGPDGWCRRRLEIRVPDPRPGRLLVTVTEDHEIHEERGVLTPALLERLLVEKSRFAADLGMPWTHMVETGSVLAMPGWAAASGEPVWGDLQRAIGDHLAAEVERGNDLQPHLHAFNDPRSRRFPYRADGGGWRPSLEFLSTAPEVRGAWASACPPPGRGDDGHDRRSSAERSVAQLEEVARLGDPDYRAVLWRSGLLEYGASPADRAWSAVALRRAGLWADSDLPKPRSPRQTVIPPAFAGGWERPFEPLPGGPLLQLPVVANLEGDYLMGPRRLTRRASASVAARRGADGRPRPGVHLFTLLTHDKFLNARAGGDEFHLEADQGDWRTVRRHVAAWRQAGATFVTAREGVREVLDDLAWQPVPWLGEETFLPCRSGGQRVRYRLRLLGRGLTASADFPHHVPVPVPPSLRPLLQGIEARQGGAELAVEIEPGADAFWLRLENLAAPVRCCFSLRRAIGPTLGNSERIGDGWRLALTASRPFRNARLLLPWEDLGAVPQRAAGVSWAATDRHGRALGCAPENEGLVLAPLTFHDLAGGALHLELRPQPSPEPTVAHAVARKPR